MLPRGLTPMAATTGALPADQEQYAFEVKWDGVRALSYIEDGKVQMYSRRGNDITARYPEVWPVIEQLAGRPAILDGEVVAFDAKGRPSFGALQNRMHLANTAEVQRQMIDNPVLYVLFDVLWLDDGSTMGLPYGERRARLEGLELAGPSWQVPAVHVGESAGSTLLDASRSAGLEGIVAKRLDSTYEPGYRTRSWIKVKVKCRQEFVVGGWVEGERGRAGRIGALLVGYHDDGRLRYAGRVGTGFTDKLLAHLMSRLAPLARDTSPFDRELLPQPPRRSHFVEPVLVGEVEFTEWTHLDTLRQPAFKGLRDDKRPQEVVRET